MRYWIVVVVSVLISCVGAEEADPNAVVIYYYGFEIERFTGIHEEEIEELGCLYTASEDKIKQSLSLLDGDTAEYRSFDVRAQIQMDGMTYFVDRSGTVRQEDRFFVMDKAIFVDALELVKPCD